MEYVAQTHTEKPAEDWDKARIGQLKDNPIMLRETFCDVEGGPGERRCTMCDAIAANIN